MLKIWGRTNSTNVKKALWAAEEVGFLTKTSLREAPMASYPIRLIGR